jgi:hypothetical protein
MSRAFRTALVSISLVIAAAVAAGCGDVNIALARLSEARQLSADLLVQFTRATDASNRAVMADTDEASVASAHEAVEAKAAVQQDMDALGPMLHDLGYAEESRLLREFVGRFAEYDTLDRRILALAVENTNLKAQRLSYGSAADAADAFRDALEAVTTANLADEAWHVRALVAGAVSAVRDIQALEAPHIAEPDDAVMTRIERRMAASEAAARKAVASLTAIVPSASRPRLVVATAALDRFMGVHTKIMALSRRNTNVRSLALSLSEKPARVSACADLLRALNDALAKRGYGVARWK